jgi:ubiquinone/menaquinone biosynthesis C-methylase UbiE
MGDHIKTNYRDYCESGNSEWRRIGAVGKAANIILLCRNLPQNSVLEIGAGEGSILQMLSELHFGNELYALEISLSGVETITKRRIPRLAECRLFDGYHIPYENRKFDIAILSHVLEHVEHPRQLLYETSRIASYVFVEVPLEDTISLPNEFVFDSLGHINYYSPKTIRRLLQSCNFKVLRQITVNPRKEVYTYQKGNRGLIKFYVKQALISVLPGLATKLFGYHAALICKTPSPAPDGHQ